MKRFFAVAGLITIGVSAASAGMTTLNDDSAFQSLGVSELWVAEARGGNNQMNGDWELGGGVPNTGSPAVIGQNQWSNGQDVAFSLTVTNGTNFTFQIGNQVINWTQQAASGNTLYVRARALARNSNSTAGLSLTNLLVDGQSAGNLQGDADANYLVLTGVDTDNITISGLANLSWSGAFARGSRLAFQFKAGNSVIPEPAAAMLGLVGLSILAAVRRR